MELTKRQKDILYAIVTEFIETAMPVGSGLVSDKYDIDASPATIRYEMVRLADEGFISKSHSSSGRIPTLLGYRFYIKDLMNEEDVDYLTEIHLKRELAQVLFERERLIRELNVLLSEITKYASVTVTEDGIYYSGLYNLLDYPEFADKQVFKNILIAFDNFKTLSNVFGRECTDGKVKVLIGDELNEKILEECSIVFTEVNLYQGERVVISVIGPKRLNFPKVIPIVRLTRNIIERLMFGWNN